MEEKIKEPSPERKEMNLIFESDGKGNMIARVPDGPSKGKIIIHHKKDPLMPEEGVEYVVDVEERDKYGFGWIKHISHYPRIIRNVEAGTFLAITKSKTYIEASVEAALDRLRQLGERDKILLLMRWSEQKSTTWISKETKK